MHSVSEAAARDLLTEILNSFETPAVVIKELARVLLESMLPQPSTTEDKEKLRKLLARLRQRYPVTFSEVSSDVIEKGDEDRRTQVGQLIVSLSVVSPIAVSVDGSLISFNVDGPRFNDLSEKGRQGRRSSNRVGRLGSKYTGSSRAGFVGR